jgi:hypothetical protein
MVGFDELSLVDGVADSLASLGFLGAVARIAGFPFHGGPTLTSPLAWLRQVFLIAFLRAAGTVRLAGIRVRKGLRKFRHQERLLTTRALFSCAIRNQLGATLLSGAG